MVGNGNLEYKLIYIMKSTIIYNQIYLNFTIVKPQVMAVDMTP